MTDSQETSEKETSPLLRRSEQAFLGIVILLGIVSIAAYWVGRAMRSDDWIEIDQAPPLSADFVVDINTADWPELVQLPDIGETTARDIVKERETNGPFANLEEVATRVRGVGPKTIEKMRPYVKVDVDEGATAGLPSSAKGP